MSIIIVLLLFSLIAAKNIPGLIRKKYWRELTVFSAFFAFALIISMMYAMGFTVPNPIKAAQYIIKDVLRIGYAQ
jgi:hypothetical protein